MLKTVMSLAMVMSTACLEPTSEPAVTGDVGSAEFASPLARENAIGTVAPCVVCEPGAIWAVYHQPNSPQYVAACGLVSRNNCSSGAQGPTGWNCSNRPAAKNDPSRGADGNIYVGSGWACLAQ